MTEDVQLLLKDYLVKHYGTLKRRVAGLLGNTDLACDALQDAWLRLNAKDDEIPIQAPGSYLVRMAVNSAVDILRRQGRSLSLDEVDSLMELSDPFPGPAQTTEGRSELTVLVRFVESMPKRRREIFILAHWEDLTKEEVAKRMRCSKRTVEYELKNAHDYLIARMDR